MLKVTQYDEFAMMTSNPLRGVQDNTIAKVKSTPDL